MQRGLSHLLPSAFQNFLIIPEDSDGLLKCCYPRFVTHEVFVIVVVQQGVLSTIDAVSFRILCSVDMTRVEEGIYAYFLFFVVCYARCDSGR